MTPNKLPYTTADQEKFQRDLDATLADVREMLIDKNKAYGDSALNPVRIFSKAHPEEQLRVRIDDKLSRLWHGADAGEDTLKDLLGYFILARIARMRADRDRAEESAP